MKKLIKILICLAVIFALSLPVACNIDGEGTQGVAYGLVHNAGYIGKATVTRNDSRITDVTLEEMCFPTQVTAGEDVAQTDRVTVGEGTKAKSYYKTIKYDDVTMVYDAEQNTYMIGNQKLTDYFQTEENCKKYFEAVSQGKVKVMIGDEEKGDIMTKAKLSKDENGYWTKEDSNGNSYSRWKVNRDATVNYVKEHGIDGLKKLTQSTEAVKDSYGVDSKYWKDSDNVSTGATWTDMYKDTAPTNYYTYSQLLIKANDNINTQNSTQNN